MLIIGDIIPYFTPQRLHPGQLLPGGRTRLLETASDIVSDFLKNQYSGAKISNIQAETDSAADGSGYELTEFASGQFFWQSQTYNFARF